MPELRVSPPIATQQPPALISAVARLGGASSKKERVNGTTKTAT
jgi:hypothetical protein